MTQCWALKSADRPSFHDLTRLLDDLHKESKGRPRQQPSWVWAQLISLLCLQASQPPRAVRRYRSPTRRGGKDLKTHRLARGRIVTR